MLRPEHIRALRQNGFPPEMVLISFDSTTIQRGVHYFETRRVIELHSDFPSLSEVELTAVVLGSRKYAVKVALDLNRHRITSTCSCTTASQCKHAIAALLQYVGSQVPSGTKQAIEKPAEPSAIQLWLADLNTLPIEAPPAPPAEETEATRMELVYLLDQRNKTSNRVELDPRKASRLKRGGYGQGYHVQLEDLMYPWKNHPFQHTPADTDITQLVIPHTSYYASSSRQLELKGNLGLMALDILLQTGRAFWQKSEFAALKPAAPRTLEFHWEEKNKARHIQPKVSPAIQDYFWLEKLFYVDVLRGECGELEHAPLHPRQVIKLLNAPPIPLGEETIVSQRLLDILPEAEIPLPDARLNPQSVDVVDVLPVPHLLLHAPADDHSALAHHLASLSFDYAGHVLQPNNNQSMHVRRDGNLRYRIHRQLDAEQAVLGRMQAFGFAGQQPHTPLDLSIPGDNAALRALRWSHFIDHGIPELRDEGWQIDYSDTFTLEFTTVDDWEAELASSGVDWFEISLGFVVEGKRINLLPILVDMLAQMRDPQELRTLLQAQEHILIPLDGQHWIKLEASRLGNVLDTLIELYDHAPLNSDGNLLMSRFQGASLADLLNDPRLAWKGAEELRALTQKLENFQGIQPVTLPEGLHAELRPYQHEGLNWLQFLREYRFNGVLADDMGLGKTLQALSHLLVEKTSGRATKPSLVIAPTSLMSNWRRETAKFTPALSVLTLHGPDRDQYFDRLHEYDLILTTYSLVLRDEDLYKAQEFHYLILDEAQAIKNAKAKTTQAIYDLKAQHRVCLTGTPMENHLGELWSMFHFLMPGFMGPLDRFSRLFRIPIEKHADHERQNRLRRRLHPFMLRRTKEHVASELPPKTEIIRTIPLEGKQRDLYETVRLAMDKKVRDEISQKGFARSQIMILDALLKLRQVCCDPRLLKLDHAKQVKGSAKLDMLMEMLPEMLDEGRKVLLFSQFTSMLALIEPELEKHHIRYSKLTGQTRDRETAINAFQEGDAQVFLISLKAGGTGLNLTAADTVIHYDPWWNPAVEQQATDRAYRIGQDKPVFVYKLLTEETVEEKILKLQERKQSLADGLYSGNKQQEANFSQDDLMDLLKPIDTA